MTRRTAKLALVAMLLFSMLFSYAGPAVAEESDLEWIDIVVDIEKSEVADFIDNPNDVVTPWVENKFHIRITEVIQGGLTTISFRERLATYIAANNLPDVIIAGNENIAYAVSTGYYGGGYEDLIENHMPNFNRYMQEEFWPRYMNDGVKTQIVECTPDTREEPYASDPYTNPLGAWSLWVREDLLAACGYTFEPIKDIAARTTDVGIMPTEEDFAIEPAIETPDDFRELLEKIQALNITVGDASLIPFSSIDWSQFHLGCMFDFGHWRITDDGHVGGFLGCSGAKDYYYYLNQLYNAGLIDPDFIVQTEDQLQSKIASGRVGAGMYISDPASAQQGLFETVGEDAYIRYISWPKADDSGLGAYDIYEGGFWRLTLKTDLEEDVKIRLIEYFDWFYSDEGMDVCTWGPEEAGLYATDENGVRYFVDEQTQNDIMNGVNNGKGADYYGLYSTTYSTYFPYLSKVGACSVHTTYNPYDPRRTQDSVQLNMLNLNKLLTSLGGYDMTGRYSYGDGSNEVAAVSSWYWSKFTGELCAPILTAQTQEEFDQAWDEMYEEFLWDTEYETAVELMTEWFEENT